MDSKLDIQVFTDSQDPVRKLHHKINDQFSNIISNLVIESRQDVVDSSGQQHRWK